MQRYNQRLIEELKNRQTQERARLPKIQRSEAKTRMAMFKKSLRINPTATPDQDREKIKQVNKKITLFKFKSFEWPLGVPHNCAVNIWSYLGLADVHRGSVHIWHIPTQSRPGAGHGELLSSTPHTRSRARLVLRPALGIRWLGQLFSQTCGLTILLQSQIPHAN